MKTNWYVVYDDPTKLIGAYAAAKPQEDGVLAHTEVVPKREVDQILRLLHHERDHAALVWDRMKEYGRALNKIGMLAAGEKAYTSSFTTDVQAIVGKALKVGPNYPTVEATQEAVLDEQAPILKRLKDE